MNLIEEKIKELLSGYGLDLFAPVPLEECKITKQYLLDKADIHTGTVFMIAVPYFVKDEIEGNISEYAKSPDYHLFFSSMFESILPKLKEKFSGYKFAGFTDHSPLDEINAAAKAGLGIIGSNGLIITEKYSSFVFIGEIITDAKIECSAHEIKVCENCRLCFNSCPCGCDKVGCLSALTQKKGELTSEEIETIQNYGSAWGCDICQKVCPHTKKAIKNGTIYSNVPFFCQNRTPFLTYEFIENMSDEDFSKRAYAWRGRAPLLRNLKLLESIKNKES